MADPAFFRNFADNKPIQDGKHASNPHTRPPGADRVDRPAADAGLLPGRIRPLLRPLRRCIRHRPHGLPLRRLLGQSGPLQRPAVRHDDRRAPAPGAHRHRRILPPAHRACGAGARLLVHRAATPLLPLRAGGRRRHVARGGELHVGRNAAPAMELRLQLQLRDHAAVVPLHARRALPDHARSEPLARTRLEA